jgi:hypothetical protein
MMPKWLAALAALPALLLASPVIAQSILDQCVAETCKARLTTDQMLHEVQTLVAAKRYDEAKPLIAALAQVPALKLQSRFLTGYVAEQTGDLNTAEHMFRAILVDDPTQTRVRLELGRTLFQEGKTASADHELRLALDDSDLPPDIARTIRSVRDIIRSRRTWTLNVDFGIAPDTNINSATNADSVTVLFGSIPLPLTLDKSAKAQSGTGVTGSIEAGLRLPVAKSTSLLVDFDGYGTDYASTAFDDYSIEAAAGPEFKLTRAIRLRIEGVVAERIYGGRVVSRQAGAKGAVELDLSDTQRLALQFDARRTTALFDHNYDGWQTGTYATYERVLHKSLIMSATVFLRRDSLKADAYSSTELGGVLGIGGELPHGFNFGFSGGTSHARYDAPMYFFSLDRRQDWRFNARASLGNRGIRVLGFSPEASLTYARNESNLTFYDTSRLRFRFTLARYF